MATQEQYLAFKAIVDQKVKNKTAEGSILRTEITDLFLSLFLILNQSKAELTDGKISIQLLLDHLGNQFYVDDAGKIAVNTSITPPLTRIFVKQFPIQFV